MKQKGIEYLYNFISVSTRVEFIDEQVKITEDIYGMKIAKFTFLLRKENNKKNNVN